MNKSFQSGQALLILMLTVSSLARGQEFEVEGTISTEPLSNQAPNDAATHFKFSCRDCRWLMRLTGTNHTISDYREVSFDGENGYFITSYQSRTRNLTEHVGNVADGWIVKGSIVRTVHAIQIGPVWLTYASRCYFQALQTNYAEQALSYNCPPVFSPSFAPPRQPVEWTHFAQFPHFVKQATYFEASTPPSSSPAITNVLFSVNATTNIGGLLIPTFAAVEVQCRKTPGKPEVIHAARYEVRATTVRSQSTVSSFKPVLPGPTALSDARFLSTAAAISLGIRTNWPSDDEVRDSPLYSRAVYHKQLETEGRIEFQKEIADQQASLVKRNRLRAMLLLLGSLILLTLLIIARRLWMRKHPQANLFHT
jgi:hypothetical protein